MANVICKIGWILFPVGGLAFCGGVLWSVLSYHASPFSATPKGAFGLMVFGVLGIVVGLCLSYPYSRQQ